MTHPLPPNQLVLSLASAVGAAHVGPRGAHVADGHADAADLEITALAAALVGDEEMVSASMVMT